MVESIDFSYEMQIKMSDFVIYTREEKKDKNVKEYALNMGISKMGIQRYRKTNTII